MLHNTALRGEHMRQHAVTIPHEVERMVAEWGEEGEIDLLEWFSELTIYTSSACLIGPKFREQLDSRFAHLYHDLERGTDPHAYIDPYADIPSFRKRDAAREGLVELVSAIMDERIANPPEDKDDRDLPTSWSRSRTRTGPSGYSGRGHRHLHLDDARRPPPPPGPVPDAHVPEEPRLHGLCWPSSTRSTRTGRSTVRRAAADAQGRERVARPCGCTR